MNHLTSVLAIAGLTLATLSSAQAATEEVIYQFQGAPDGAYPSGNLITDKTGNLYGATSFGGFAASTTNNGCGTIFELQRSGSTFNESILWSFQNASATDGCHPTGNLIMDASGNLFGTTSGGGANVTVCNGGCGTVFELSPNGSGGWNETILFSFGNEPDGIAPQAGVIFGPSGSLYGSTQSGGACPPGAPVHDGAGTVFQLTPNAGVWTDAVLHTFACTGNTGGDGWFPGSLTLDTAGNIYGATPLGGDVTCTGSVCNSGYGTVFELQQASAWAEAQLAVFKSTDKMHYPSGPLLRDHAGHLYGAAQTGVYLLTHGTSGWRSVVLYTFGNTGDGALPYGDLVARPNHLYGTTADGGSSNNGTVFELTHTSSGWSETVLYSFGAPPDGSNPLNGVLIGASGNLFGTTYFGGQYNKGAVFEVTP
jgi:uncharacterized repeat protein (TIGR03803 family)